MWRKILIISIALVCLMVTGLFAQKNQYRKADHALRAVYKEVTGKSLQDAIDQIIAEQRGKRFENGNVVVQFNGGGTRNRLYIGRKNTLEFLVENDYLIQSASLGFEFSCTAGPGSFDWVQGYGSLTAVDSTVLNVVEMHLDCFSSDGPWNPYLGTLGYPDTIILGGMAFSPQYSIDSNPTLAMLYSMQIELPDDPNMIGDTFYVDNIFIPPGGDWLFQEAPPGDSDGYAPDYQWMQNSSQWNPDAPPVAFKIAEPKCEFAGKSTNPNIVYIPNDSVNPPVNISNIDIFLGKGDKHLVSMRIGFIGDMDDLKQLGILNIDRYSESVIGSTIPLELLPRLCQLEGVQFIRPGPRAGLELNYSTNDINCVYSAIQSNLGVSGKDVILGILDTGIDWLHEDFIDSNGNSIIKQPHISIN